MALGRTGVPSRYRLGLPPGCKHITFKRKCRGSKKRGTRRCVTLPKSQWVHVVRCDNRSTFKSPAFKAAARRRAARQCRRGGRGPKAHLFVRCPAGRRR